MKFHALAVLGIFFALTAIAGPDSLIEKIRNRSNQGLQSVVIFDLDDTLFDSRSRKKLIHSEFVQNPEIRKLFPRETAILSSLQLEDIHYGVEDTLLNAGIRDKDFISRCKKHWASKFFTNEYAATDDTLRGAVRFVQNVHHSGAMIAYLTGRDQPNMEKGTIESLRRNGFPLGKSLGAWLYLKPNARDDDAAYKALALEEIAKLGPVVATFENEPRNSNLMKSRFPQADHYFLETLHSNRPDVPHPETIRIPHYE